MKYSQFNVGAHLQKVSSSRVTANGERLIQTFEELQHFTKLGFTKMKAVNQE